MTSVLDMVREEAAKVGLTVTDDEARDILWMYTGYPSFWSINEVNTTPEACLRAQLKDWAERTRDGTLHKYEEELDQTMAQIHNQNKKE